MGALSDDLKFRGLIHQVTDEALYERIDKDSITLYGGFDPTAPSLHVGHLTLLLTLRRFEQAGHRPIALAGGGTGLIGDPGGKSGERTLLSKDELAANLEGIRAQMSRLIDLESGRALLLNNAEWLVPLAAVDFLRDVGKHFTVNQMVAKESVKSRLERPDQGISYTEFSYMLLQAYDFLRLHQDYDCSLQVGGSDQWGNITMGTELIRKVTGKSASGLTSPLVTKADGTKFGKTESGTVWLDPTRTSPFALHQFFLTAEDAVVGNYLRIFTFFDHDTIRSLDEATASHPERREATKALADAVVTLVHGEADAKRVAKAAAALFSEEIASLDEATLLEVVAEAPSSNVSRSAIDNGWLLVDALVESQLVASKGEARRTIEQGGAYVNNRRMSGADAVIERGDLLCDRYVILRKGRRDYHLVRVL
jgi:tyrosyl-tRNA synthetase